MCHLAVDQSILVSRVHLHAFSYLAQPPTSSLQALQIAWHAEYASDAQSSG